MLISYCHCTLHCFAASGGSFGPLPGRQIQPFSVIQGAKKMQWIFPWIFFSGASKNPGKTRVFEWWEIVLQNRHSPVQIWSSPPRRSKLRTAQKSRSRFAAGFSSSVPRGSSSPHRSGLRWGPRKLPITKVAGNRCFSRISCSAACSQQTPHISYIQMNGSLNGQDKGSALEIGRGVKYNGGEKEVTADGALCHWGSAFAFPV